MRIADLKDGQVVRARWGRAGEEDVAWGPWQDDPTLAVQHHKGRVVLVTLKDFDWAEYGPEDQTRGEPALLLAEDYYLEVEGLT